jgi:hypothetical protein
MNKNSKFNYFKDYIDNIKNKSANFIKKILNHNKKN